MNTLVIIGNGFDIAHGLPTKYSDFMKYLAPAENIQEFFTGSGYGYLYNLSPQDQQAKQRFYENVRRYIPEQDLWNSFEEALSALDEQQLQDDNSCYLLGYGDENWRDSAHHDFQCMIDEALSFAPDISYYFSQWISGIYTNVLPKVSSDIINKNYLFLTFNYTDTLESVYDIPSNRIFYIHGKALRGDRLIVGHHNGILIQDDLIPQFQSEEEREEYYDNLDGDIRILQAKEIIKKYYRGTYKDTSAIIQQNRRFFLSLNVINEIYILGHSLSEIDIEYFVEIKKNVPQYCQWNISYHNYADLCSARRFIEILCIQNFQLFEF